MKRLIAATLGGAFAVAMSGSVLPAADATPASPARASVQPGDSYSPTISSWGTCASASLQAAGAQCAMVTVPLDYDHPDGTKIQLAISRIKHTVPDAQAQGIMLVNPGGPGGSGLTLSRLGAFVPKGAGGYYDWIGFDPRGVGHSVPSLTCDGSYFPYNRPDYRPYGAGGDVRMTFWQDKAAGYTAKCADPANPGSELLPYMTTPTWATDMDQIRKALGADKINYYGFSYGTYLGQVYSTMFPDKVGRMVWDGVVRPSGAWYDDNLDQDYAFDKTANIYFGWIARNYNTYHLGKTQAAVKALYYKTLNSLVDHPAAGGKIGPDEWGDAFQGAAYYVYGWEDTAKAFADAINHDRWQGMVDLYDGTFGSGPGSDNTFAVYQAVECTDAPWPTDWNTWRADNDQVYSQAPFLTWSNVWFNAGCLTWHAPSTTPTSVGGSQPILLIEETYDPATPYNGALEVRDKYPHSVMIEGVGGTTHAGSLSGVSCTDDRIADYLISGKLDPRVPGSRSDVQCPPVPQPDPSKAPDKSKKLPADLRAVIEAAAH